MPRGNLTGRGRRPAPIQVQAEAGQDWEQLAESMGIEVGDLVKANPSDTDVKAGAVYNVPPPKPLFSRDMPAPTGMEQSVWEKIWERIKTDATKLGQGVVDTFNNLPEIDFNWLNENILQPLGQPDWYGVNDEGSYLPGKTKVMASMVPPDIPGTYTPAQPYSATTGYISPQDRAYQPSTAFYDPTIPSPPDAFYSPTIPGLGDAGERPPWSSAPTPDPSVTGRQEQAQELRKIPLPPKPSAFEAVNWLTGAGLTGTALLSAGHQLRLDRPEYWDATGAREDVIGGMEKFLIAEFPDGNGGVDWDAAIAQDPYIGATLEKLGYLSPSSGFGEDYGSYGGYNYPIPSYSGGYGASRPSQARGMPSLGLVSWSI